MQDKRDREREREREGGDNENEEMHEIRNTIQQSVEPMLALVTVPYRYTRMDDFDQRDGSSEILSVIERHVHEGGRIREGV